ncbi:MAG: LPS-assembly protein LptD [Rhizobiales bacterium]|nr:LPS-assembly protein LptD [Hyphomicrobiales bacterium]MBO6698472.1 LPS-assembly protein LptD [Hyphomicrobiales bacterium]MBO6735274.1 LPS-assembly protein LptD [Hyphomicrobiales bacterium]MBO6910918.1 LPS-assembly protein LptD [Hyphomicrobiales bacterium]MBO6955961.1 LPS-assembly protein LptD [Hyphomicrobiales bacterium]
MAGLRSSSRVLRLGTMLAVAGSLVVTGVGTGLGVSGVALAQVTPGFDQANPDAQMFLEADELLYNEGVNTVTALGNVTIFYDGYTVDADEVVYDRAQGRVLARGNVILVEPSGNIIRATSADLSDTLADGFVDALSVETPERGFFTARNATRRDGSETEFDQGTYTACEACPENPDRPRAWMFHADTITYDEEDQMVYYRNVRLDFFGIPIVWLPFFAHTDPTVERKSGFLRPEYVLDGDLGFAISTPYYFALDPSYDLTVTPTFFSGQAFHLEAEWRQRLENGGYSVRVSGAAQLDDDVFNNQPGDQDWRGGIASNGAFSLNDRWDFGWNLYLQSDRRYFRDYSIETEGASQVISDIYLTGLHDRSYFDARVERIQVATITEGDQNQPWTLPVVDYDRRFTPDHVGGELQVLANLTTTVREDAFVDPITRPTGATNVYEGLDGQMSRATLDVSWRREFIGPLGQVFTPQVGFRGDVIGYNLGSEANVVFVDGENSFARGMASAGLEWRWPFLITAPGSSHVVEPVAQFIVRPDAGHVGEVPIEDSQSLVFDASNLFDWDKYSGFDQMEGGTRANVGVRYTGTFDNGLSLSAIVGQSFHLAGENPYAWSQTGANILTPNGEDSGLETDQSDYVAMLTARLQNRLSLTASGRFDEDDFDLERGELLASASHGRVAGAATYAYLAAQPNRGINDDQHQISGSASLQVNSSWRVAGSVQYDLERSHILGYGAGIQYVCDCLGVGLNYTYTSPDGNDGVSDSRVMLNVSLRTIGAFETEVLNNEQFNSVFGTQ